MPEVPKSLMSQEDWEGFVADRSRDILCEVFSILDRAKKVSALAKGIKEIKKSFGMDANSCISCGGKRHANGAGLCKVCYRHGAMGIQSALESLIRRDLLG